MSVEPHGPVPLPAAIAPHLLHSPNNSPHIEQPNFLDMDSFLEADSPHSLNYPSPPTDSNQFSSPTQPHASITESVASPNGMLMVHSYGPASGPPNTPLATHVDFTNLSGTNVRLRIVFGDIPLPTTVSPNVPLPERPPGHERGEWSLRIYIPPIGQATTQLAEISPDGQLEWPLTLQALDVNGTLLDSIPFGLFAYDNYSNSPESSSPASSFEYRARSKSPGKQYGDVDDKYSPPCLDKRFTIESDMSLRRMSLASDTSAYMSSQQESPATHRAFINTISSVPSQNDVSLSVSPQAFHHHPPPESIQTLPQTIPPNHYKRSPMSEIFAVPSNGSTLSDDSPSLIRTSQLNHDTKSEQASIGLQDDLETMKRSWNESERKAGRRLVQFWKRQVGTTLQISFEAIPQSSYKENTIVVSCIYREDVDDYFITSVDVIYLLEALAGSRFEVEEKNRIRRNLEGFKPLTISKSKPGTEDFFRIIMEFPPPRPRNIEKDVKVFEWGKLKMMLEKVFSKYSTVSALGVPSQTQGPANHQSKPAYAYPRENGRVPVEQANLPLVIDNRSEDQKPVINTRTHSPPSHSYLTGQQTTNITYSDHFLPQYGEYGIAHSL